MKVVTQGGVMKVVKHRWCDESGDTRWCDGSGDTRWCDESGDTR